MSLNQPNSFPLPIGTTVSFVWNGLWQTVSGLYQAPNFTLTDKGLYTVTVNFSDSPAPTDQVVLNTTTGAAGSYSGTLTSVLTVAMSGYYSLFVPQGGATYAFTSVNPIKIAAVTSATGG